MYYVHATNVRQPSDMESHMANHLQDTAAEALIPAPQLAGEFSITRRTLARWLDDPTLGFPQPTRINNRLYFSRSAVEEWKAARLRQTREAA
jgi:predicted DNA-binding transcriptional regulator AlpA